MSFQTDGILHAPCLDSISTLHISPFPRTRLSSSVSPSWVSDTLLCSTYVYNTTLCLTAVLFCLNLYRVSPADRQFLVTEKVYFYRIYIFPVEHINNLCVSVIGHDFPKYWHPDRYFIYVFGHRPKSFNFHLDFYSLIARIWLFNLVQHLMKWFLTNILQSCFNLLKAKIITNKQILIKNYTCDQTNIVHLLCPGNIMQRSHIWVIGPTQTVFYISLGPDQVETLVLSSIY